MASSSTTKNREIISLQQAEAEENFRSKSLWEKAFSRILHDRLTLTALAILIGLATLCFSAPIVVEILDVEYNRNDLYNHHLPPGSRVADSNTTTLMWDGETGEHVRSPSGHIDTVLAASFTPDGSAFATASIDGSVRLWQTGIGRHLRLLEEHNKAVNVVRFHPEGALFLTAGTDGVAYLWEIEKAEKTDPDIPVLKYDAHEAAITDVAFSPDGESVFTGDTNGIALLWNTRTGATVDTFTVGDNVAINAVAYSPDGGSILTGHADGQVRLWNVETGEVMTAIAGQEGAVNAVAFGPDGETVLTAGDEGTAHLWTIDGKQLQTFIGHEASINSALFGPDGISILTGSSDGTARLWDIESGEVIHSFDEETYPVRTAIISPDGETVVTGTEGRRRFYLLGTDGAGRDLATRLLVGGQISLKIGFLSAIGALTIGILLGIAAGYWRGAFDDVVMWIITTLNSIPSLFLLLIISAMLAPNDTSLILVLVFLGWTGATRIVRGETFSLREREFVMAARAVGASPARIMFVHISPNVISVLLIVLARSIGGLILAESSLSFLGFGVKPPTPTWGNMLTGGLELLRNSPHLVFAPGLLISVTVLCLYVIGDGLRDAFDPKISD